MRCLARSGGRARRGQGRRGAGRERRERLVGPVRQPAGESPARQDGQPGHSGDCAAARIATACPALPRLTTASPVPPRASLCGQAVGCAGCGRLAPRSDPRVALAGRSPWPAAAAAAVPRGCPGWAETRRRMLSSLGGCGAGGVCRTSLTSTPRPSCRSARCVRRRPAVNEAGCGGGSALGPGSRRGAAGRGGRCAWGRAGSTVRVATIAVIGQWARACWPG